MNKKNKIIAAALAFLLGFLGFHKFYLGKFNSGLIRLVLYLLFWLYGFKIGVNILYVISFIEGIMLITSSVEQFDSKYNQDNESEGRVWGKSTAPAPPKNNPYIKSGNIKYKEFDYAGAIEDYTKGLVINPRDNVLHFNLACAYSLTEDAEKSLYHLSKAVEYGYNDFENIKTKDDLAFLRVQPTFESFMNNKFKPVQATQKNFEPQTELPDLLGQIKILNQKRERGELTDDEYFNERKKLLD